MGQLFRVFGGQWTKSPDGVWRFDADPANDEQYILTKTNEQLPALRSLVREEMGIRDQTPMVLSYHLPDNLQIPFGCTSAPTNVVTGEDVELLFSVQGWSKEVELYVTYGALNVAKYQFLCREPFKMFGRTFLGDGITEEEHLASIIDFVGDDVFDFSNPGLPEIFNEKNLVLVYRFSLEMRKARSLFGRNNRHGNDLAQMSGDEGGEDDSYGNLNPHVNHSVSSKEQGQTRGGETADLFTGETESVVIGPIHRISVDVDLTGEEHSFVMLESNDAGNRKHNPDDIYVGMIFKNREDFKQHMAMYAIRNKFRFRNSRSSPGGMILRCFSPTCTWHVYAILLKNSELFEVRTIELQHSCTVDERCGYQSQATHTVIGGMMKARFAGTGGGPRPNDIMQAMEGDHDVRISYGKAWRSREVALEYTKGSSGESYNLLPAYLNNLVNSNPGSITDVHTEYTEGFGHRFKYMFMALSASIEGYKFMRKVVIVDGTHLKGKYSGCLLTACAQDGNYQVFPLAIAVVDGENYKAWEWFFQKLTLFIPDSDELVFVSDRHQSIYYGIAKVYPKGRHCACILHLKRNVRTYFKDKHLGYLVGKAARAYKLSEFYTTFNEIKRVNASCADYLIGIGFTHWARSHFQGNRYNIMTSNVAETWNSVLREAREYPILSLVEYIRAKLMTWFATRRDINPERSNFLTPRVQEIVTSNFERSGMFE
ncbi:hypothetical protein Bca4012_057906 [Brassica carinata]